MSRPAVLLPLAAIAIGLAACRGTGTVGPLGEPLVVGPVESITHHATASGVLVRAAPGSRDRCGIAARVDADTRYLRRSESGELLPARLADLEMGDTVEVYVDGPVAESCPMQGRASTIVSRFMPGTVDVSAGVMPKGERRMIQPVSCVACRASLALMSSRGDVWSPGDRARGELRQGRL